MYRLKITGLAFILVTLLMPFSEGFCQGLPEVEKKIRIGGLIVDSRSMNPIAGARISGQSGEVLGTSDDRGYYDITLDYAKSGSITFNLKIEKSGYADFVQQENWGNLAGNSQALLYVGMGSSRGKISTFSSSRNTSSGLTYADVVAGFEKTKLERAFESKLRSVKLGNEDVFVHVDGKGFLVNNSGWIAVTDDQDLVSVDGAKSVAANKLNQIIMRREIKWMSPVKSKTEKFALRTK